MSRRRHCNHRRIWVLTFMVEHFSSVDWQTIDWSFCYWRCWSAVKSWSRLHQLPVGLKANDPEASRPTQAERTPHLGRRRQHQCVHVSHVHYSCKAVVPCQNKIILKNFRPEPPPSVDRPKTIIFQRGTTSKIILKNFTLFRCFILTWNHVWNEVK